ncbi:MAG TPA: S-methyl-5-thioribose-1-phosphate isomerase [Polyangiaceae bacterium]|jgi:methylthioribose-1-phosphate isomerase
MTVPHPEPLSGADYSAVELSPGDDRAFLLDQRELPHTERYLTLDDVAGVADAIERLAVRGAPAIGIAAAYGMVLAARRAGEGAVDFDRTMAEADARLRRTRPTAVNLMWALDRMARRARSLGTVDRRERVARLAQEARAIHREDVEACRAMGRVGAARVADGATVLTHCNAGALATGGYGTALGVVRAARDAGKTVRVVACETRPVLQGARLTAWELSRDGFDVTLVTDSMVGDLMRRRAVDVAIVGADRIARNGDVANKIGTYGVACLADLHGVPFFVAAPWSTFDPSAADGDSIPVEHRDQEEVLSLAGRRTAPAGVRADNPAFDVTPARLVRAIFTERGEVLPVGAEAIARMSAAAC